MWERQKEVDMLLVNTLLSYFVLMLVFVAVAGIGAAIGLYLRKRKNTRDSLQLEQE